LRVGLLKDIRAVFGDDADLVRSADLVTKLTADPERPWAEWKRGKPLSQKQLGGLLRPFGICSVIVGPLGAQTRGYRRWQFEEAWTAYCPEATAAATEASEETGGQNVSSRPAFSVSTRQSVNMPMKSKQVDGFRSVNEGSIDTSKSDNLSYSHAGFDGLTGRKPKWEGREGCDQAGGPTEDQPTTSHPPPPSRPQSQPVGVRPATNGRAAPGAYIDAQGKPTDDPELGYYGRAARAPLDAAYQAATEKQPDAVADVPDQAEKAPPAADVISAPDPVPPYRPPMLEGDRRREAIRARNQAALARLEAEIKRPH
jgi:hypothetical protein